MASSNNPSLPVPKATAWAARWGSRLLCLQQASHIKVDSGFGTWPQGLALVEELQRNHAPPTATADIGRRRRDPWSTHKRKGIPTQGAYR